MFNIDKLTLFIYTIIRFFTGTFVFYIPIFIILINWAIYYIFGFYCLLFIIIIYVYTMINESNDIDKSSLWKMIQKNSLWSMVTKLHDTKIIIDSNKTLNQKKNYIYGFHPHGVLPVTMGCLINSPKLNNYAVNLDKCICLIHSIILNIPLLRELFLALGCNKATHDIFDTLLKNKNNIFLCPGGINEMVNTYKYIKYS